MTKYKAVFDKRCIEIKHYQVGEKATKRGPKMKPSSEKVKRKNKRKKDNHVFHLINNNFSTNDHFVTLTFRKKVNMETAQNKFYNFRRRIERLFENASLELKYIYFIEAGIKSGRIHIHLIINADKKLVKLIGKKWVDGKVDIKEMYLSADGTFSWLSAYVSKAITYQPSTNLDKVEEVVSEIPLDIPSCCIEMEDYYRVNSQFGYERKVYKLPSIENVNGMLNEEQYHKLLWNKILNSQYEYEHPDVIEDLYRAGILPNRLFKHCSDSFMHVVTNKRDIVGKNAVNNQKPVDKQETLYHNAVVQMNIGNYREVTSIFKTLDGYKNSETLIENCYEQIFFNSIPDIEDG